MANSSIIARLGLDSSGFQGGLTGALGQIKGFAVQFTALLGGASLTAMSHQVIGLGKEIRNLSDLAGLSAEEFQAMVFAAKTVGVEQDKLADILKDVNDKVGDFLTTGAGPMADFFEKIAPKVGVTAEQFRGLSGNEALQLYVDTLQKANVNQQEMTFFMEAIASDSSLLIPLLHDGGAAFKELGDEARRAGAIISEEGVNALNMLSDKLETGKKKLLVAFAPALIFVVNQFVRFINFVKQVGALMGGVTVTIIDFGDVAQAVFNPFISLIENAGNAVKGLWQAMTGDIDAAMKSFDKIKDLDDIVEEVKRVPEEAGKAWERFTQDSSRNMQVAGEEMIRLEDEYKAFEKSLKGVEDQSKKTMQAVKAVPGAAGNADKVAKAREIIEQGLAGMERKRLPANQQLAAVKKEQADIEAKIAAGAGDADKLARDFLSLQRERVSLEKEIADSQKKAHDERMAQLSSQIQKVLELKNSEIDEKLGKEQENLKGMGQAELLEAAPEAVRKQFERGEIQKQEGESSTDALRRTLSEGRATQAEAAKKQARDKLPAGVLAEADEVKRGKNESTGDFLTRLSGQYAQGDVGASAVPGSTGAMATAAQKNAEAVSSKQDSAAAALDYTKITAENLVLINETLANLNAALK
jgi:hypothetical protein